MQPTLLSSIPVILLLRSDQILYELLNCLTLPSSETSGLCVANLKGLLARSVNAYRPDQFRREDIERAIDSINIVNQNTVLDYGFDYLEPWYREHITTNGASIEVLPGHEVECSAIFRKLHPYTLIGFHFAQEWQQQRCKFADIKAFAKQITPLLFKRPLPHLHYAENHIHIFGANEPGTTLMQLLESPVTEGKFYRTDFIHAPHVPEFELLNGGNLTIGQLLDLMKCSYRFLLSRSLGTLLHPQEGKKGGAATPDENHEELKQLSLLIRLMRGEKLHEIHHDLVSLQTLTFIYHGLDKSHGQGAGITASGIVQGYPLLLLVIYFAQGDEKNRSFFVLCIYLHWLHQYSSNLLCRASAKLLLHGFNILRSYMVMSRNTGLAEFTKFYDSAIRRSNSSFTDIAESVIASGTTKLEGKITPKAVFLREHLHLSHALDRAISNYSRQETGEEACLEDRFPLAFGWRHGSLASSDVKWQYHFVVHFLRKPDTAEGANDRLSNSVIRKSRASCRFGQYRSVLEQQAVKLKQLLHSKGNVEVSAFHHYLSLEQLRFTDFPIWQQLQNRDLNLAALITGLDVAGKETDTPPEVFAPILLYLRSDALLSDLRHGGLEVEDSLAKQWKRHKRLRLFVHAGEDFSHLITGLRRIDETVEFYRLSDSDRLGHALALGIPPRQWMERAEEVFLPLGEHLDNLVWLHHQLQGLIEYYSDAAAFIPGYEREIARFSKLIYGCACLPYELYQAWRLRSNCPRRYFNASYKKALNIDPLTDAALNYSLEDACNPEGFHCDRSIGLTSAQLFYRYHHCCQVRENEARIVHLCHDLESSAPGNTYSAIPSRDEPIKCRISDGELWLWTALQDHLMTRYARKGLVIEANPTSNIYIAKLNHYGEHPIFRFYPPKAAYLKDRAEANRFGLRNGVMPTCINTDDPTIMPTTLPNEFLLLKQAAIKYHDCSMLEAEQWVEGLRSVGVEHFLANHQAVSSGTWGEVL
ncbi:MAG: hypothetical protein ABW185_10795 [Sedimenticola sp.]